MTMTVLKTNELHRISKELLGNILKKQAKTRRLKKEAGIIFLAFHPQQSKAIKKTSSSKFITFQILIMLLQPN